MYIADLHIHSKYSRATSRDCVPESLDFWARRKGIGLLGTGDFTHPAWREELRAKLVPAEEGLYVLREEYRIPGPASLGQESPRFVLTGEISSIYKKNGRVRKVHNLILLPGLEEAEALAKRLELVGNLHSDGRPILGLDSRDLLEITLEVCPEAVFIPAHIWTPHFSMFGAFSGFDTMEECFGDMTPYIHALETGLSSDPPMNWRLSALDSYALVSNSDAHSPAKLGREANLITGELSYPGLARALHGRGAEGFSGTIEFFPEEGKYHLDGHRNCGLRLKPGEAEALGGVCPVCGGRLTIGVLHRVEELADRMEGFAFPEAAPFESLIPLPEIIGASTGFSAASTKVGGWFEHLLQELGPEFFILREAPIEEIERTAGPLVAEGIRRVRRGEVRLDPGFDGEYGKVHILDEEEMGALAGQISFFGAGAALPKRAAVKKETGKPASRKKEPAAVRPAAGAEDILSGLNEEQRAAVTAGEPVVMVIAGPGTGKTKTLVARIAYLVEKCGVSASEITAVTFTNKAAGEMRERLEQHFGSKRAIRGMTIGTFHSIALQFLSEGEKEPVLIDESGAIAVAEETVRELSLKLTPRKLLQGLSRMKNSVTSGGEQEAVPLEAADFYQDRLRQYGVMDFDDLLLETLRCWEEDEKKAMKGFRYLLVDEFQDINEVQYRLVRAWSRKSKSLFVIGDPDQAIYGFRGSDSHCFERLREDCPGTHEIRLKKNYRSTPEVLRCALALLSADGQERCLEAQRAGGPAVRLLTAGDDFSEGIFLAKEINRMVGGIDMLDAHTLAERQKNGSVRGFSDIAILYRTHRQAEVIETCLRKEGIPYLVTGRDKTLSDPLVSGTAGFFRFLLSPAEVLSLRSSLKLLGGSPALLASFPQEFLWKEETTLSSLLPEKLRKEEAVARWEELSAKYRPLVRKEKPQKLLEKWAEDIGAADSPVMERLENTALLYKDMPAFLHTLSLGGEADVTRSGSRTYLPDAVSLMTLHGAKGLEFPAVFLSGVRKGVLPLEAAGRETDYEEERRLLYVGLTRAREELILMTGPEPSPFLRDIPAAYFSAGDVSPLRKAEEGKQLSFF